MNVLENRIPPPIITAIFALVMWLISGFLTPTNLMADFRISTTVMITVLAMLFLISGGISFRLAKTTVNPLKPESASSLVVSGAFKISRNPMYVGFALLLLAWCVYLSAPVLLMIVLLFRAVITRFQIIPEERAMLKLFGEEFIAYQQSVRRWL
jgi:protein-S-isoprenylcysteine O-methyltransferase Ste14|tara:strand:- start:85 stop:546 length:462 start_codon:yes stop_codon:yes gene_type:complete